MASPSQTPAPSSLAPSSQAPSSLAPSSLAAARAMLLSPLGPVARAGDNVSPVRVSFEFFPPKTDKAEETLWEAVRRLEPLNPEFVSVTYGAGGSTRERTHRTVQRMLTETTLKPAAHLTCVEASRAEVDEVIESYKAIGVNHIVALRGDPPGAAGAAGRYLRRRSGGPCLDRDRPRHAGRHRGAGRDAVSGREP